MSYWYQTKMKMRLIIVSTSFYFTSEAVVRRCSVKKVFLEISQNSQENTCARVSFLVKLQASSLQFYFIKKETLAQVISCEFCKIYKNTSGGCFYHLSKYFDFMVTMLIRCVFKWTISVKYLLHLYFPQFQNFDFQDFLGIPYINW